MNWIIRKYKNLWKSVVYCGWSALLAFSPSVTADELRISYIDDGGHEQSLAIDANSSDVGNALAATLILDGNEILVVLDEKEDLEVIADSVSEQAPDKATAIAVRNSILGVSALLGGRSIQRTAHDPDTDVLQVDTPPLSSPRRPFEPLIIWPSQDPLPPPVPTVPSPFTPVVSPH